MTAQIYQLFRYLVFTTGCVLMAAYLLGILTTAIIASKILQWIFQY